MIFRAIFSKIDILLSLKNKNWIIFNSFKNHSKMKSSQSSKSIIQKIATESTINNKYQNQVLKIEKI